MSKTYFTKPLKTRDDYVLTKEDKAKNKLAKAFLDMNKRIRYYANTYMCIYNEEKDMSYIYGTNLDFGERVILWGNPPFKRSFTIFDAEIVFQVTKAFKTTKHMSYVGKDSITFNARCLYDSIIDKSVEGLIKEDDYYGDLIPKILSRKLNIDTTELTEENDIVLPFHAGENPFNPNQPPVFTHYDPVELMKHLDQMREDGPTPFIDMSRWDVDLLAAKEDVDAFEPHHRYYIRLFYSIFPSIKNTDKVKIRYTVAKEFNSLLGWCVLESQETDKEFFDCYNFLYTEKDTLEE